MFGRRSTRKHCLFTLTNGSSGCGGGRKADRPRITRMIKETLADLVRIDSVSSRSNIEIVEYLEKRCQKLHMMTGHVPYIDKNLVQKFNLIAVSQRTSEVELAIVGHTDTVPYDPNWSEATNLTERDGKLY